MDLKHTDLCEPKSGLTELIGSFGIVYARRAGLTMGQKLASLA